MSPFSRAMNPSTLAPMKTDTRARARFVFPAGRGFGFPPGLAGRLATAQRFPLATRRRLAGDGSRRFGFAAGRRRGLVTDRRLARGAARRAAFLTRGGFEVALRRRFGFEIGRRRVRDRLFECPIGRQPRDYALTDSASLSEAGPAPGAPAPLPR